MSSIDKVAFVGRVAATSGLIDIFPVQLPDKRSGNRAALGIIRLLFLFIPATVTYTPAPRQPNRWSPRWVLGFPVANAEPDLGAYTPAFAGATQPAGGVG
ncbi:hypothetical protein GGTG_05528 [Gaeumannomyces tritici R3-111a-1]|uniref:Uncharacterized protein n=1 Tax=Gaeumannomyces tritici (strain R3-111a-1) TaxID=644352 RepID=J3NW63_GAET3|nr:hypothetical protein GGTG_05528 [Gaeumannomyces tritici R3-111a-1]EJT75595.1 hypothetical protein GGTG_05528 [Gaeumannomyces tritici R3-111a-1]